MDGSPACPFVAFEDDRDARSTSPDHRHRCYAEEGAPAPRAAAHQEAYCLSSAFPVCPTFQGWARREAARAKAGEPADREREARPVSAPTGADEWPHSPETPDASDPIESTPRRNPPRDWAAPPPWAPGAGAGAAGAAGRPVDERPAFVGRQPEASQGLAGSAADRLAGGGTVAPRLTGAAPGDPRPSDPPHNASASASADADDLDPEIAALVARPGPAPRPRQPVGDPPRERGGPAVSPPPPRGQPVSSTRSDRGREAPRAQQREHVQGPSWERARRNEAYPTIRTRAGLDGLPALPRVAVLFGALIIAAVALFFLPALLGIGGPDTPGASTSPSASIAAPTATPAPTPEPEPTPQTYTIKQGDTLSKIATAFGVTVDQLLAANADTIEDANKIAVGDVIIVPAALPDEVPDGGSAAP